MRIVSEIISCYLFFLFFFLFYGIETVKVCGIRPSVAMLSMKEERLERTIVSNILSVDNFIQVKPNNLCYIFIGG